MSRSSFPIFALSLVVLIWLLNQIAITFYLYWTTFWYDIPMHLLGGLTMGVLIIWSFGVDGRSWKSFLTILIAVIVIGIGWEVFERVIGQTFAKEGYILDTMTDLLMDAMGAIASYFIVLRY